MASGCPAVPLSELGGAVFRVRCIGLVRFYIHFYGHMPATAKKDFLSF